MAAEKEPEKPHAGPWGVRVAIMVIVVLLGLVVYVTLKTTEIPVSVAIPLLAAAAFGLWAFKLSDFRGGG